MSVLSLTGQTDSLMFLTLQAMKILSKKKLQKKAGIFGRIAPTRKGPGGRLIKKAENPLDKVNTISCWLLALQISYHSSHVLRSIEKLQY